MTLNTIRRLYRLTQNLDYFEQILQETAEIIHTGMNYYAVCVYTLDHASQYAQLKAACGPNCEQMLISNYRLSLISNSPIVSTIQTAETHIRSDIPSPIKEYFPLAKTEITCPIFDRENTIGVIVVYLETDIQPEADEVKTCQLIADLLASAYRNKRLDRELRILTRQSERRMRLQLAANQIAIAAGHITDLTGFLQEVVDRLCEAYGLYYAGIFLVDEKNEWAVLHAGYGTAGELMIQNHHQLRIGGNSMIGTAIRLKEARIAMNIGEERVHFRNPQLPDTRSEMALPLHLGDFVFGAITIQSREEAAFHQDEILSLQTLTHFLSPAIWQRMHS